MLSLHLQPIFAARGIERPFTFLVKAGFSRNAATRLLHNAHLAYHLEHIEKLCILFHCSPNDLLVWQPSNGQQPPLPADHPLQALRPKPNLAKLQQLFKQMPLADLAKLAEQLQQGGEKGE